MSDRERMKRQPAIDVRIEPNAEGTTILWNIRASDGTKASGFARCHADAMRDAAAFVEAMAQPRIGEAMAQPRIGGLFQPPELRIVPGQDTPA